jgi:TonB family protein
MVPERGYAGQLLTPPSDLVVSNDGGGVVLPAVLPALALNIDRMVDTLVELPAPKSEESTTASSPDPKPAPEVARGGRVELARLIYRVVPEYPLAARAARIDGTVQIHATVNEEGFLEEIEVISGNPLLIPAAMKSLSQWRYEPARLNGKVIRSPADVTVHFKLTKRDP